LGLHFSFFPLLRSLRISIVFSLPFLPLSVLGQGPTSVTLLDKVNCQARWRPLASPQESPVDEIHDRGLPLDPGGQIRCITPGYLTLITDDDCKTVKFDDGPYTIPAPKKVEAERLRIRQLVADAISFQSIPAGSRGKSQRILFPVEDQALLPSDFLIRWKPLSEGEKISFVIFPYSSSSPLWSSPELDGDTGVFPALTARPALEAIREQSPCVPTRFQLQPSIRNQPEDAVDFTLLCPSDEASLHSEIRSWDQMNSRLLQYLGRGYSYSSRNLFFDAAREYDRAVAELGDSCRLLILARNTNAHIGLSDRVDLLNQKISRIPDSCSPTPH
jgi:hypothetical protein